MSTTSQHLGLTVPDPSDPFKRTDFVNNYNAIDAYPGVFICSSTTRPTTWGANQAGMLIYESDTRRHLVWDGSAWHQLQTTAPAWTSNLAPAATITPGQTVTYTIGSINVRRPATLISHIYIDARANRYPNAVSPFGLNIVPLVDNVSSSIYNAPFHSQWTEFSQNGGTYNDYRTISVGGLAQVTAGSHSVGVQIAADTIGSNGGAIQRIGMISFLANSTDV